MLKSEASLTGFAVSPRIARTLQRCENFTCARVSNEHFHLPFPRHSVYFFPLLARGLIPRLIAHAEQTIFFFYYFVRVRMFRFNKIARPRHRSTIVRPKHSKKLNREDPNRIESEIQYPKKSRDTPTSRNTRNIAIFIVFLMIYNLKGIDIFYKYIPYII